MPHKRARNPLKRPQLEFNVAPGEKLIKKSKKNSKAHYTKENSDQDGGDTPKAFQRLMKWSQKKQGLIPLDKDLIKAKNGKAAAKSASSSKDIPLKILPGEKLGDFARRVDEALPLVKAKGGAPSRADKKRLKKKAKAEEEAKKAAEKAGEASDEEDQVQSKRKGGKREVSPDPWAHLQKPAPKFGEVADRPPQLDLPTKLMRNVPKSAGSVARRLALEDERSKFIADYRFLVEQRRKKEEELHRS